MSVLPPPTNHQRRFRDRASGFYFVWPPRNGDGHFGDDGQGNRPHPRLANAQLAALVKMAGWVGKGGLMSGLKPPKVPCGSCPYRKDVPPGIWAPEEYAKVPDYDLETWRQPLAVFMCHQNDGCICGGWLLAHDREHLLALRVSFNKIDASVWEYQPNVAVFSSGREAERHGLSGVKNPPKEARRKIAILEKQRSKKN